MKTRDDPSRLERKSMRSCHRDPGCELLIAGFRLRLSRRPLRGGMIFRFCDISRVCRQDNFPSHFCAALAESRAGRLSATRLRSSRASSGRLPHDRVGARIFRGFLIFQGFAGRKTGKFRIGFPSPPSPKSRAGGPSETRLRSSRKGLVREAAVPVEFRARARSHAHRRPAPGMRDPFGIAAWNRPQRNPQAVDRNGPARVGANEESRGARSRMPLRLQRNDHAR